VKEFFLFPNRAGGQKCKKIDYQKTKLPLVLFNFFMPEKIKIVIEINRLNEFFFAQIFEFTASDSPSRRYGRAKKKINQ
jgi:hypothetical protein